MHLAAGVLVALSGAAGTVFVIMVNAWMNTPVGFEFEHGKLTSIDPVMAMQSPAAAPQAIGRHRTDLSTDSSDCSHMPLDKAH